MKPPSQTGSSLISPPPASPRPLRRRCVAQDASFGQREMLVTMESLMACPRPCPRRCDERIMKMTMLSAYLPSTHTWWQVLLFWRIVHQFWGLTCALWFSRWPGPLSSVGNGRDSYVMAPLIGQYERVRYPVNQSAFCLDLFEFWTWCNQKSATTR